MSQSFDPASPARWLIPLRRLSLLHEALKGRQPVRASELAQQPWWAEQSRRNWRRDLQQLAALGAPLTYQQEAADVIYRYTGRWDLWSAIRVWAQEFDSPTMVIAVGKSGTSYTVHDEWLTVISLNCCVANTYKCRSFSEAKATAEDLERRVGGVLASGCYKLEGIDIRLPAIPGVAFVIDDLKGEPDCEAGSGDSALQVESELAAAGGGGQASGDGVR